MLGNIGKLEIDHMRHTVNINTACGNISGNQHTDVTALESLKGFFALGLALVAVNGIRAHTNGTQLFHNTVCAMLGAREDQSAIDRLIL